MSFSIKAMCKGSELLHRRKTAEAALRKAQEMSRTGCYNIHIITPEGRDYHSSEFGDLPRGRLADRHGQTSHAAATPRQVSRSSS
jgi:hypothetical protein